ncbi:MAG: response regulator [Calditrichaeota bacterium]|nr:MAG: response regulator [Calditrichota bacterium]MBL1205796.1 response regulator [Calditrichota bacterium]NOG45624.1 response regulator [Calditrichota bacterium]
MQKKIRKIINTIWSALLNIHVNEYQSIDLKIEINKLNAAIFLIFLVSLLNLKDALQFDNELFLVIKLTSSLFYLVFLMLKRVRYIVLMKTMLYFTVCFNIFVASLAFGQDANYQIFYIPILFGSFYIYNIKSKIELTISLAIPAIALFLLQIWNYDFFLKIPITYDQITTISNKNLFSAIISSLIAAGYFSNIAERHRQDLLKVSEDQEKLNLDLKYQTELLRSITENIQEVFWVQEKEKFIYISPAFEKIFERPVEAFYKEASLFLTCIAPEERERIRNIALSDDYRNKGIFNENMKIVTPSGEIKWIHNRTFPIFENDELTRIVGIAENITFRKKQEQDLINAHKQAIAAAKAKSEFLSIMSHEIRTPMNAVVGMTHLLLSGNPREDQVDSLKTLQFSSENLLALINDILDFSKIEAGKIEIESVDFNLERMLVSLKKSAEFLAIEKHIAMELSVDDRLPEAFVGDVVRLTQILNNLVINAVKFTNKGSVTIKVELVEEKKKAYLVKFSVIDTGIGIPKEKQKKIFQRFTQAFSETTRKFGGTGLGLTITKRLLEIQGSKIELKSEEGKGSNFFFILKLRKSENISDSRKESDNQTGHNLKGLKVLLVEDNRINSLVAMRFLQKWEIEVETAENGEDAIGLVLEKKYDVVLMDLHMPVMDGFRATEIIRKHSNSDIATVPIIALTADALSDVREHVFKVGMDGYVTKPFDPENLFKILARYSAN